MQIVTPEGAPKFYKLTAEPLTVSHAFGQPVLATVTIQNVSDYDITLGDDGTIKPDLWFDAKLIGLVQQVIPAIAYDRIGQQVVLKAKTGSCGRWCGWTTARWAS
jgi:hypothetical protein